MSSTSPVSGNRLLSSRGSVTHPAFSGPWAVPQSTPPLDHTGSLLRMFRSEAFDAHLHIAYLFKMKDNQGVQDYLTNELYRMREKDVDFYLPELCHMALSRPLSENLHAFLLDKAASRMYYALKIHWMFQSAVEDKPSGSELLENALKLYQESEMAIVNSRAYSTKVIELRHRSESVSAPASGPGSPATFSTRLTAGGASGGASNNGSAFLSNTDNPEDHSITDNLLARLRSLSRQVRVSATERGMIDTNTYLDLGDAVPSSTSHWRGGAVAAAEVMSPRSRGVSVRANELDLFMLKQLRCDCFNGLNNFVHQLTRLSSALTSCPTQQDRRKALNLALAQLNHWLLDRRLAIALTGGDTYLTGLHLPIVSMSSERTHVIKAHVEDSKVFRTRQRAPYLVTLEVVDFADLGTGATVTEFITDELLGALAVGQAKGVTTGHGDAHEGGSAEEEKVEGLTIEVHEDDVNSSTKTDQVDTSSSVASLLESPNIVPSLSAYLYPDTLVNRRVSTVAGEALSVPPPVMGQVLDPSSTPPPEVIVVDDSAVSIVGSRRLQRRATMELRRKIWGELHEDRIEAIRSASVYGSLPSWRLLKVMVKGDDDVRQEVLAGQLVSLFRTIFNQARLPLWLRPYEAVVTSVNSGLIELVPDTISIDALKKEFGPGVFLNEIFTQVFADHLEEARLNFIESCAAYSVVCYFLQIRDRHNGNLLIDSDGHLIHIDFGFMLSNAPGGSFALETSPFKLTQEFVDVMGGEYSSHFETFRTLVIRAFLEARKHRDQICQLVRIVGECNPRLGCFAGLGVEGTLSAMSERFCVGLTEEACIEKIVGLIDESVNNWRTIQYDNYQRITNGIL